MPHVPVAAGKNIKNAAGVKRLVSPQGYVKVRLNPVKKIPLNPPLIKGDLIFPPFEKGGYSIFHMT